MLWLASTAAMDNLSQLWRNHVDKLASRAGTPKDLVSVLSGRGSQNSYAKAAPEVCRTHYIAIQAECVQQCCSTDCWLAVLTIMHCTMLAASWHAKGWQTRCGLICARLMV